jgi:OmpA-OmpF porin, OOP family
MKEHPQVIIKKRFTGQRHSGTFHSARSPKESGVNKLISLGAALLVAGFTTPALSQNAANEQIRSPWYIGLGISRNDGTVPEESVDLVRTGATTPGATFTSTTIDDRFAGAKLFVGYRLFDNLALEAGATDLGTAKINFGYYSGPTQIGFLDMKYSMSAIYLDAVGTFALDAKWSVLGRVGVSFGETRVNFEGQPVTIIFANNDSQDETKTRIKFGAGAQYHITPTWILRGEWERYDMPDPISDELIKIDSFTGSIVYQF